MTNHLTAKQKYRHEGNDFPILYENNFVRVYKNSSDEIFVEDIRSGATMRINSRRSPVGGLEFTTDRKVQPIIIGNMIGWHVRGVS